PDLLTSRSTHTRPCLRRDAGLPDHSLSRGLLERLRCHGCRRPPRPDDALSRRSVAPQRPQLSLPPSTSSCHRPLPAQRRHHAPQGLLPLGHTCVHEEKTPIRTPWPVNSVV